MNEQTLVAVYDTPTHADAAVRDLRSANVPNDAIKQHAKTGSVPAAGGSAKPQQGFWASLFGTEPDDDTTVYDRSVESGSTVVAVRAPSEQFDRISTILEKHNPVDLDSQANRYGSAETTAQRTTTAPPAQGGTAATDGGTLPLAEESLSVGKRAVSGGTTRIRRYAVQTPVQEQVNLRSEKVTLDRRPVTEGRPVGDADFTDKSMEMTETNEEAVVSKNARVTEEVSLHKEASDRVETVKDNVRRDEVEIENVPGERTTGTRDSKAAPATSRPGQRRD